MRRPRSMTAEQRFWSYVELSEDSDCWVWTGCRGNFGKKIGMGYGKFKSHGEMYQAHRFAYELFRGRIPEGMDVCHNCDRPECVNPAHLFTGTQSDNMKDRAAKGRYATQKKGEDHYMAKLTEDQCLAIKKEYAKGKTSQRALGEKYGVTQASICRITRNENWKETGGEAIFNQAAYDLETKELTRVLYASGMWKNIHLQKLMGISHGTLWNWTKDLRESRA